jgi:hypothetical protein
VVVNSPTSISAVIPAVAIQDPLIRTVDVIFQGIIFSPIAFAQGNPGYIHDPGTTSILPLSFTYFYVWDDEILLAESIDHSSGTGGFTPEVAGTPLGYIGSLPITVPGAGGTGTDSSSGGTGSGGGPGGGGTLGNGPNASLKWWGLHRLDIKPRPEETS